MAPKSKEQGTKRCQKRAKTATAAASQPTAETKPPCRFLELPPEVRNRIYDYAIETVYHGWSSYHFPSLLVRDCTHNQYPLPYLSSRNFFGLTQVNEQIRTEYRPIWLHKSSILIKAKHVTEFLHSFYGLKKDNYSMAPKLLQISWHMEEDLDEELDLTDLLEIRARSDTKIELIPGPIADDEGPVPECNECELDNNEGNEDVDLFDCPHWEMYDEWLDDTISSYLHLTWVNDFLANKNPQWLAQIRDGSVFSANFRHFVRRFEPTITINLSRAGASSVLGKTTLSEFAKEYLSSVGHADLQDSGLEVVFGVRSS
ncbi:hypothetical protein P280DRAFT_550868 [Massarina eburnea CBS 473.64]|uniref:F-box domain-containing protein n=1 Tax=Massarina eburnea CBS 473.64 TaxID=1395130 RepID=A0A6A6RVM1_9PLEO|nr:hypothetical protein P280DRAFT_550868 [Massarina eburnea CBS 473.64]